MVRKQPKRRMKMKMAQGNWKKMLVSYFLAWNKNSKRVNLPVPNWEKELRKSKQQLKKQMMLKLQVNLNKNTTFSKVFNFPTKKLHSEINWLVAIKEAEDVLLPKCSLNRKIILAKGQLDHLNTFWTMANYTTAAFPGFFGTDNILHKTVVL